MLNISSPALPVMTKYKCHDGQCGGTFYNEVFFLIVVGEIL